MVGPVFLAAPVPEPSGRRPHHGLGARQAWAAREMALSR